MQISKILSVGLALGIANFSSAAAGEIQLGGELNVVSYLTAFDPMNFDNISWSWKNNADQMGMESLTRGNLQKGPRGTNEYNFKPGDFMPYSVIEGSLAESWELSHDPLQITFKLRQGVNWMPIEGVMEARPLDANDVVKSFEAMNASPTAVPAFWSFVDRWEAKDDHTVIMHLNSFHGAWDYMLTWGYYDGIMPVERLALPAEERADWRKLGGTGPFRLTELRQGEKQVYQRNPDYWDRETIGGKEYRLPLTDRVVQHIIRDPSAAIAALVSGEVDVMESILWQFVDQIKQSAPELNLQEYTAYSGTYISLRVDQEPFDDVRVRRALNIAVDQQAIVDAVMGGNGELLNYPFNSAWTGYYQPIEELSQNGQELFTYNPERAKELLREAGLENGLEFDVIVNSNNQTHMNILPMVQAYYELIGVKMNIRPMEVGAYQAQRQDENRTAAYMIDNGSGTPIAVLRKSFLTGQAWNPSFFSDPEFDAGFEAASQEIDEEKRVEMLRELNRRIIEDDVPHVWLPTQAVYTAWWPWVKNYHGELAIGAQRQNSIYARIWIDQQLKKDMGY